MKKAIWVAIGLFTFICLNATLFAQEIDSTHPKSNKTADGKKAAEIDVSEIVIETHESDFTNTPVEGEDELHGETGIIVQFRNTLTSGSGRHPFSFEANLVFLNKDEVVMKLPVRVKPIIAGACLSMQVIMDDDEWGLSNIDEIDGMAARTIVGTYHGGKVGLCILAGGSCFAAFGNEGLLLYSGEWLEGLGIDVGYANVKVSAVNPNDERWDTILNITP